MFVRYIDWALCVVNNELFKEYAEFILHLDTTTGLPQECVLALLFFHLR